MKSKTRFSKAKEKSVMYHSGFYRYIKASYQELIDKLGQPHDCTKEEGGWWSGDGKIRVMWVFKDQSRNKPTVVTVYDYKDDRPLETIDEWHIGSKGDLSKVDEFLKDKLAVEPRGE